MNSKLAMLVAVASLSIASTANAEMMRAFWAGNITDAVSGNAMDLAVGEKLIIEMSFDNNWITSAGFAGPESVLSEAAFYYDMPSNLGQGNFLSDMSGEIRLTGDMRWQAFEGNQMIAAGTWELDSVKFAPRVVPIPAALPLMIGALGLLAGIRRRR